MVSQKNPFARSATPPAPADPEVSTLKDPERAVKRWELEQGRTHKRIEDLTTQHAAAAEACEKARHTYGARVESEEDASIALTVLTQSEGHLRGCEAALTIAK